MKISEMIKNLQEFMAEHGDLECWYAVDDEGNAYHKVYFPPSMYFANEEDEVYQSDDLEYFDLNEEDIRPICIVN
jgi:hypothetical protein